MKRALFPAERLVQLFDELYTMSFTTYAVVDGSLDEARVRRALDALVLRHPLLGAAVVGTTLREGGAAPIELVVRDGSEDTLPALLEDELRHRTWAPEGPRARCTFLRHTPSRSTLLLTFDHVVSDGSSGVIALRDLLHALGTPEVVLPTVPSPGQDAFFPEGRGGFSDFVGALALAAASSRKPPPLRVKPRPDVAGGERRTRLATLSFTKDESTKLAAHARAAGATVHGLLVASALRAIAAEHDRARVPLRVIHPIDLRRYLPTVGATRAIGDAVGYYVSSVDTDHELEASTTLEALSREVTLEVRRAKSDGVPFLTAPAGGRLLTMLRTFGRDRFAALTQRAFLVNSFGVTNLGPLEALGAKTRYGELVVDDVGFVVSPSITSSLMGSAASFDGSIRYVIHHVEPIVSSELAGRIVGRIREELGAIATA